MQGTETWDIAHRLRDKGMRVLNRWIIGAERLNYIAEGSDVGVWHYLLNSQVIYGKNVNV